VIPTFKVSDATLGAENLSLWMDVYAVLKPDEGTALDMLEISRVVRDRLATSIE
jgi:hypothetical protein